MPDTTTTRAHSGRLAGLTAVISGAGGPMGAAIAARFATEGASLGLIEISAKRLEATAASLRQSNPGSRVAAIRASVLVQTEVEQAVAAVTAQLGSIDILVNVVGGVRGEPLTMPLLGMTEQRFDATFDLNLKGLFWMVQATAPGMVARSRGSILNISSVTFAGDAIQPEYGAAKAAVASLTRSLAMELAPHVTVNCIAPGLIQTSVLERAAPQLIDEYATRAPLKRLGKPEDIANAALFLCSQEASFITGAILPVAGGIWPAL
ncbi:MAG: SDR family NAD(P)-dependent oxidoreductase [Burkholderiaceae bacterium]